MKLNDVEPITLYKGATTFIKIDLKEFEMRGGKVVFAIRENRGNQVAVQKEFTELGEYCIIFTDDLTKKLDPRKTWYYDIMWHLDGERIPQTQRQRVNIIDTAGGLQYE